MNSWNRDGKVRCRVCGATDHITGLMKDTGRMTSYIKYSFSLI